MVFLSAKLARERAASQTILNVKLRGARYRMATER